MIIKGEPVNRYFGPSITEYVDMETGEIIRADELRDNPELWPVVRASERVLQREYFLKSLRKEVQLFAKFVLSFRNQRRGITPGIDKLVQWYGVLHDKRACDVRRYVPVLEETGFLVNEGLLAPLFQVAGKKAAPRDHLAEQFIAETKFLLMNAKGYNQEQVPLKEAA